MRFVPCSTGGAFSIERHDAVIVDDGVALEGMFPLLRHHPDDRNAAVSAGRRPGYRRRRECAGALAQQ